MVWHPKTRSKRLPDLYSLPHPLWGSKDGTLTILTSSRPHFCGASRHRHNLYGPSVTYRLFLGVRPSSCCSLVKGFGVLPPQRSPGPRTFHTGGPPSQDTRSLLHHPPPVRIPPQTSTGISFSSPPKVFLRLQGKRGNVLRDDEGFRPFRPSQTYTPPIPQPRCDRPRRYTCESTTTPVRPTPLLEIPQDVYP